MEKTHIQLDKGTAENLARRKGHGESYDDVVNRILDEYDEQQEVIHQLRADKKKLQAGLELEDDG